jgi:hypothetical protein
MLATIPMARSNVVPPSQGVFTKRKHVLLISEKRPLGADGTGVSNINMTVSLLSVALNISWPTRRVCKLVNQRRPPYLQ